MDNIVPKHLINLRESWRGGRICSGLRSPRMYFKYCALGHALNDEIKGRFARTVVITDKVLSRLYGKRAIEAFEDVSIDVEVYRDVMPEPP